MAEASAPLAGRTVVFAGRLLAVTRRQAERAVAAQGGQVQRGLTRRSDLLVVGRALGEGAALERLEDKLARADRLCVRCIGEARFLAAAGLAPPAPAEPRPLALAELEKQTGLEPRVLRLLALFDVIAPEEGRCRFRDLVAAREVARLLGEGSSLVEILRGATTLTRLGATDLAAARLVRLAPGGLGLRLGDAVAELDGQMLLPMGEGEPDLDALFEAAEAAEASGDLATAERLYGRCAAASRDDPTIQYNLANVLRAAGRLPEAELRYRLAIQLDPRFAEAWYNLAHVLADRGRATEAERCLEQALAGDPEFGDALYNLAQLRFERDDYAGAAEAWERYLAGDRDSPWAHRAKAGLAVCRQRLRAAAAGPARRPPA